MTCMDLQTSRPFNPAELDAAVTAPLPALEFSTTSTSVITNDSTTLTVTSTSAASTSSESGVPGTHSSTHPIGAIVGGGLFPWAIQNYAIPLTLNFYRQLRDR